MCEAVSGESVENVPRCAFGPCVANDALVWRHCGHTSWTTLRWRILSFSFVQAPVSRTEAGQPSSAFTVINVLFPHFQGPSLLAAIAPARPSRGKPGENRTSL